MKIRIWHKLALVLLLTTTLVIVTAFVLAQLSFRQDFSGYIKDQQKRQVELLSERLAEGYEQAGSWDFLKERPRLLRLLIRESFRGEKPTFSPPPPNHNGNIRPPFKPDRHFRPQQRSRIAILDEAKVTVLGDLENSPSIEDFPIKLNEKTIGYLRVRSVEKYTNKLDERFIQSQMNSFMGIGLVALVLSLLAAWLLSHYFKKRFIQLTDIAHDLTAGKFEKRIEITHNDELTDLGRTFNVLANTLEKNRHSQKQWIADISHELRTPLSILSGEIEALEDGIRPLDKKAINSLANETKHLNHLVDDLYQLSLSDLGALDYKKDLIDLNSILSRTIDQFELRLTEHELQLNNALEPEKEIIILGDEQRFVQLFSNLLDNAIKYTDRLGQISISAHCDINSVHLTIEDSSPGIPKEHLTRVFDRLYRVDNSRNRKSGGAGLGLAIASSIVEAHDGKMSASDSTLGGLKLTLEIPLAK